MKIKNYVYFTIKNRGAHQGKSLDGEGTSWGQGGRAPWPPEAEAFLVLKSW